MTLNPRIWQPVAVVLSLGESLSAEVLEELSILRSDVAELYERLDFAERVLAQPRPAEDQPSSLSP
jgi:hypothetical protein